MSKNPEFMTDEEIKEELRRHMGVALVECMRDEKLRTNAAILGRMSNYLDGAGSKTVPQEVESKWTYKRDAEARTKGGELPEVDLEEDDDATK